MPQRNGILTFRDVVVGDELPAVLADVVEIDRLFCVVHVVHGDSWVVEKQIHSCQLVLICKAMMIKSALVACLVPSNPTRKFSPKRYLRYLSTHLDVLLHR